MDEMLHTVKSAIQDMRVEQKGMLRSVDMLRGHVATMDDHLARLEGAFGIEGILVDAYTRIRAVESRVEALEEKKSA